MAKISVVERNKKRIKMESKYRGLRNELKEAARQAYIEGDIPWDIHRKLQKLPRNSNPTRVSRRCRLCGRSHAVYRMFGLCRLCLRKYAMLGYVPGLETASW